MASLLEFDRAVLSIFRVLLDEFPSSVDLDIDSVCISMFGEMPSIESYDNYDENCEIIVARRNLVFSTAVWLGAEGFVRYKEGDFFEPGITSSGYLQPACLTAKALSVLRIEVETLDGKASLAQEVRDVLKEGSKASVAGVVSKIIGYGCGIGLV